MQPWMLVGLCPLKMLQASYIVCDIIIVTREEIVEPPAATTAATTAGLHGKARVLAEILRAEARDDQNTRATLSIVADI